MQVHTVTFLAHPTMNDTSPAKKWQPSRNGVGRADMLRQSSRLAPYPVKSYVLFACEVVSALRADTGTTPIHMLRLHPVLAHMHAPGQHTHACTRSAHTCMHPVSAHMHAPGQRTHACTRSAHTCMHPVSAHMHAPGQRTHACMLLACCWYASSTLRERGRLSAWRSFS